jgi:hypothetical protein
VIDILPDAMISVVWLWGCEHPALGCDIPANVRCHVFWHQQHGKFHRIGNALDG